MRRTFTHSCCFAFAMIAVAAALAVPARAQSMISRTDAASLMSSVSKISTSLPDSARSFVAEDAAADYTGILIDSRQCSDITRSMSPAVYGPSPDYTLVYPDRSHVPTPDEVQDESIVRYYHTLEDATKGVAGANPLILSAVCVTGYAKDSVVLTAADMKQMTDLDQTLHFTRTWKVGFLIPPDK